MSEERAVFSGKVGTEEIGSNGKHRINEAVREQTGAERIGSERLFMAVQEAVLKCCVQHSVTRERCNNVVPEE